MVVYRYNFMYLSGKSITRFSKLAFKSFSVEGIFLDAWKKDSITPVHKKKVRKSCKATDKFTETQSSCLVFYYCVLQYFSILQEIEGNFNLHLLIYTKGCFFLYLQNIP